MNKLALKFGYWSSVISVITFVGYIICFVAILFVNPLFAWTNYENYIKVTQTTNQDFKHIAMFLMIVYGMSFVMQLCSIEEIVESSKKYYVKIAELFGIGFCALIGINYFIQISAVRMQIGNGQTSGLEQFIQSNPISAVSAINMLGWTIFFGMSCLFIGLAFGNAKIEKVIKYGFIANGITMFLAAVGYLFNIVIIIFLCMYIGMGAAILIATIPLCRLFKNLQHEL